MLWQRDDGILLGRHATRTAGHETVGTREGIATAIFEWIEFWYNRNGDVSVSEWTVLSRLRPAYGVRPRSLIPHPTCPAGGCLASSVTTSAPRRSPKCSSPSCGMRRSLSEVLVRGCVRRGPTRSCLGASGTAVLSARVTPGHRHGDALAGSGGGHQPGAEFQPVRRVQPNFASRRSFRHEQLLPLNATVHGPMGVTPETSNAK